MKSDSTTAMMPAAIASQKHTSNAARVGTSDTVDVDAHRREHAAHHGRGALEVPTERNRAFRPFEAPSRSPAPTA